MLHLGLFNFRNDDVVLVAGDKAAVAALGTHLRTAFDSGQSCVAIHDFALVSTRHPALLFAIRGDGQPLEKNSLIWRCSETNVQKLLAAASGVTELYFELTRTPPYLYVNFSGYYDEAWWSIYG